MSKNKQILLDEIVKQELENIDEKISISDFFESYAASTVLKTAELGYDELEAGLTGKSQDGGADAIYTFVNGDLIKEDDIVKDKYKKNADIEVIIIQAKFENSFGEDAVLKLSRLCKNLFDLGFERKDFEGRYNEKVLDAFELFRNTYVSLVTKRPKVTIKFYYVSKGIDVHPNVNAQSEDLKSEVSAALPGATVEFHFVGAEKLIMLSQSRPNDVFKLKVSETPMSTSEQVFIALTKLSEYFRFISDADRKLLKHIFESNVRDYQGKTNVNNEIQETLEKPGKEEFWWLNNGVTILASHVSAPGGKELVIHDPEIVNGLQTSSEIHRFFSLNPGKIPTDSRDILIRVIVPESEETRDRIIRATNSQTPIPKASLRATDQIHREIEDYLKPRGLFYDRRKNYYKNEGKKPKDIISVPFMAQCLISVLMQRPDSARARPSTLLEDDAAYEKLFHTSNDLKTYYLVALTGRGVEQHLKITGLFTSAEMNNIRFFVLYAVFAVFLRDVYPNNASIAKMKVGDITPELIDSCENLVYDLYREQGGGDKLVKGTGFTELVRERIRSYLT